MGSLARVGLLAIMQACSFTPGVTPSDASKPPDVPPDTPTGFPASCKELHARDPSLLSSTYQIDPDGPGGNPSYSVRCDMSTDGGGWTIVYFAPTANVFGPPVAYTTGTPRLMTDAQTVLIAYRDSSQAALANYASFPLPDMWRMDTPFDVTTPMDVTTEVSVNGGAASSAILRFGTSGFNNSTCGDDWAGGTYGRLCIAGTTAPFFTGFASTSVDACADSLSPYNATGCTSDRRFSIAVR